MKRSAKDVYNLVKNNMTVRNIVIWGTNENAKRLYLEYKEKYHITTCVSSETNPPEYLVDEQDGLKVITWDQYEIDDNDFIIICESPYVERDTQLMSFGLVIFEDYVGMQIAEYVLSGKKLAIMAGNCQIATVFDYIKQIKAFTDEYYVIRYQTYYFHSRYALTSISVFKGMCDLYLCMNHEEDDPMFFKKEELSPSCRILIIPYVMGCFYWPQIKSGWRIMYNELFIKNKETLEHGPFEMGDININRMITEGKSVDEIVEVLSSEDFYSEEQVNKHYEKVMRVAEYEEQGCDIHILPYIKENVSKFMIYRDMIHLHPVLACEYARQILLYLEMDDSQIDRILEAGMDNPVYREHSEHCTQMPVYPSVAKHMDLEWYDKDMTWDVTFYNGMKKLTFEEYIRAYYSLCSKMKQVLEEW